MCRIVPVSESSGPGAEMPTPARCLLSSSPQIFPMRCLNCWRIAGGPPSTSVRAAARRRTSPPSMSATRTWVPPRSMPMALRSPKCSAQVVCAWIQAMRLDRSSALKASEPITMVSAPALRRPWTVCSRMPPSAARITRRCRLSPAIRARAAPRRGNASSSKFLGP